MNTKEIEAVVEKLRSVYKGVKPGLDYNNTFELLIATILSAQCTDERVNKVSTVLFKKAKTPMEISKMNESELAETIRSCGLYRMKSKNIIRTCELLISDYDGNVPEAREKLMKLPGVGRKTANVVLNHAFGKPAIAVDTHVQRVSNRIGLAVSNSPQKTELQLMENLEEEDWGAAHLWLIHHGRKVCTARKPKCDICPINKECRYYNNKLNSK
ncbi:MAG: endonuclease III [Peptostreptococcaceae bacterium]|nr:endonuclease III [Peptostreptococcaceae bacterium]